MKKIICTLALLTLATPLFAASPFAGTWKSNPDKSKYTMGTAPKEVTLVIEEMGTDLKVTGNGTNSDGSPISVVYTVPVAGGAGKVETGDFDAISAKMVSDHARVNTYMKDGKKIRTRRMTVSKDGKTMMSTITGMGTTGSKVAGTDVYDKQ
jgi:hypothetical protein